MTLIVSRQQVLPQKDPEVAAALETDFLGRGVHLMKGAPGPLVSIEATTGRSPCAATTGRSVTAAHVAGDRVVDPRA
ncbi:MAG: hypothetical protein IPH81_18315 [Candidatus Microthrix sp.]|nr:hypothetical protein [Candidatus Microthrix sp.]